MGVAEGAPLLSIASLMSHAPVGLAMAPGVHADEPKDLEGKVAGIVMIPSTRASFDTMLEAGGVDAGAVKVADPGFALVAPLLAGKYDAVAVTEFGELVEARAQGEQLDYLDFRDWGTPDFAFLNVITDKSFAQENPNTARAFVDGHDGRPRLRGREPRGGRGYLHRAAPRAEEGAAARAVEGGTAVDGDGWGQAGWLAGQGRLGRARRLDGQDEAPQGGRGRRRHRRRLLPHGVVRGAADSVCGDAVGAGNGAVCEQGGAGRTAGAALLARGLSAGWAGEDRAAPVLAGIDLDLAPGGRLAVVGQSGCGKSTLLHVLAGLLAPSGGEVLVDGRVVAAADLAGPGVAGARSGHAAYMFQQDLLLPWKTALANAVFAAQVAAPSAAGEAGAPRRRARATRAALEAQAGAILEEFGLGDALQLLPRELSGGMRQRVALARTLVLGRALVLLDEPFGSLDALTRAEMRCWLLEAMEAHPATWVLVTHDVSEAVLLGDRVAVLAGRPARLGGWLDVPLGRRERRALARAEAGGEAGADAAIGEAGETLRSLAAEARRMLMD